MKVSSPLTVYDAQGLVFGVLMTSLGVVFLKACSLVTGQTAGLSILLSYLLPLDFGVLFLVISAPFFWLAWKRRGPGFTLRTIFAVAGISALSQLMSQLMTFDDLPPLLAAILAGACCGVGLIALFRHNASAGGLGILALVIEEKTGFKTGWFQLCFDAAIFVLALIFLPLAAVVYSFIGAVVLNLIIVWNFRIGQVQTKSVSETT